LECGGSPPLSRRPPFAKRNHRRDHPLIAPLCAFDLHGHHRRHRIKPLLGALGASAFTIHLRAQTVGLPVTFAPTCPRGQV